MVRSLVVLWVLLAVSPAVAGERERLRAHFTTVDRELRAADIWGLTDRQRDRRAAVIAELERYRDRGVFPRNLDFDVPTPYFVDARGVRCAMAHLIETFGGSELVAAVAARSNNAYVRELAADEDFGPALGSWLERHGLTVAEAARIQPGYQRMVGERCIGALYYCMDGVACTPAEDDPDLAFCSPPCDPAASTCPIGLAGIQMECQARGDQYLCVYPGKSPGSLGWECDANTASVCEWACIGLDEPGDIGSCSPPCSGSQPCPDGYECEPLAAGETDHLRTCYPLVEDSGCSASKTPPVPWFALFALALGAQRRRVRARLQRSSTRCRGA